MYEVTPYRNRRHKGVPPLHDIHRLYNAPSFAGVGGMDGFPAWNISWTTPNFDMPNNVEQATRRHVEAQKEHDKAKEKYEEAKKKLEECEKKVKEADKALSFAKHQASW
ncbi:hypothetical protein ACJQWK_11807 [Exserohilum turcicum]|uniref:Uncharacterized protein n=1 Tax=Exserohilum turcicum (strain 28A) TaxID=671987 RepID=R0IME5_EXST2|nr:uncharacterized protein SETTUDRAFT_39670 [Exserohilum turcica Et28A]EOA86175.1 hypothetical protein SETTUDRAFT_39670 [Exserohilum turcica Et28A]